MTMDIEKGTKGDEFSILRSSNLEIVLLLPIHGASRERIAFWMGKVN